MKDETTPVGSLLEKAETYGETSIELIKLKALETSTQVVSSLIIRILLFSVLFLFALMVNIAAALWLGEHYGRMYIGFLAVASVDAILMLIVFLFRIM